MTREEAFRIMDKLPMCNECNNAVFPYSCDKCQEAFLMAMEALKQPEIVRCKDCRFFRDYCHRVETLNNRRLNDPEWFCADGERETVYKGVSRK